MYYLRDLEEQIEEARRQDGLGLLNDWDRDVLEELQSGEVPGFRKVVATALVQLGLKLDREAALTSVSPREAA